MTYKPSPRPTFDGPAAIPYGAITRHLWGDEDAGEVADWIYVSSDRIHQLVYGLPPGARSVTPTPSAPSSPPTSSTTC